MDFIKKYVSHFISGLIVVCAAVIFMMPQLQDKIIAGGDVVSSTAWSHQVLDYQEETGIRSNWNPSMFSGMPWGLLSLGYQYNVLRHVDKVSQLWASSPMGLLIKTGLVSFLAFLLLRIHPYIACIGALGLVFNVNFIILLEAGHQSKLNVLANFPMILAGLIMCFNGRWKLGSAIIALFTSIAISNNHIQMVYYLLLTFFIFGLASLIIHIVEKRNLKTFLTGTLIALIAAGIGGLSNYSRLVSSKSFSEDTMRGTPILKVEGDSSSEKSKGLEWEYAMQWSNDLADVASFLIPRIVGGSSYEEVSSTSATGKLLRSNGSKKGRDGTYQAPMYWGGLPFTSGPYYSSMLFFLLLILGGFFLERKYFIPLFSSIVFLLLLSMGSNASWLNKPLFDYLPLFSKFRAPNSAVTMIPLFLSFIACLTLNKLIIDKKIKKIRAFKFTAVISLATIIIIGFISLTSFSFEGPNDARYGQQVLDIFIETREALLLSDFKRGVLFAVMALGVLFAFIKNIIKQTWAFTLLLGLVLCFDLVPVDRRHLDIDNWESMRNYNNQFALSNVDQQIMSMEPKGRAFYRVMDVPNMQSAKTSYHHNTIGGYHAAKLQRYQDILDYHVYKGNMSVINMLNAKYIIQQDGQLSINQNALGNAWSVQNVVSVNSPEEEITQMSENFDAKNVAIINASEFPNIPTSFSPATISMEEVTPNYWKYNVNSSGGSYIVFSEVWYPEEKGLNAYIDGSRVSFSRVNYILRGIDVPAGNHTIEFKFEPKAEGSFISLIGSILILVWVLINFLPERIRKKIPYLT